MYRDESGFQQTALWRSSGAYVLNSVISEDSCKVYIYTIYLHSSVHITSHSWRDSWLKIFKNTRWMDSLIQNVTNCSFTLGKYFSPFMHCCRVHTEFYAICTWTSLWCCCWVYVCTKCSEYTGINLGFSKLCSDGVHVHMLLIVLFWKIPTRCTYIQFTYNLPCI